MCSIKKLFIGLIICVGFQVTVFSQELKNPTMKAPFSESSGNFLVLTAFNKIGKSEITIDYVKNLQQELNNSKKLISEQQKQSNDQKKDIEDLRKLVSSLQRQLDEQKRKIEDLQRKVK